MAYNDVKPTDWSKTYIDFVTSNNLMKGYTENGVSLFKPKNSITREEMAVIIVNLVDYFNK